MKAAIITTFNEAYAGIADVTLPLMKLYADKHGYGLEIGRYHEDPANLKTYGDRGKIDLFLKHYDEHDVIMFLDIDVLVMNHEITIEDQLGDERFLWSYDCNGPCSGFWIAQCVPQVAMMFNKVANEAMLGRSVIAREVSAPHRVTVQFEPHGTSDQMMMRELMTLPPYSHILQNCKSGKEVGHCYDYRILKWPEAYDYMGHYEPGDWLYTLPSVEIQRRKILLARKAKEWYDANDPGSVDPAKWLHAKAAVSELAAADDDVRLASERVRTIWESGDPGHSRAAFRPSPEASRH